MVGVINTGCSTWVPSYVSKDTLSGNMTPKEVSIADGRVLYEFRDNVGDMTGVYWVFEKCDPDPDVFYYPEAAFAQAFAVLADGYNPFNGDEVYSFAIRGQNHASWIEFETHSGTHYIGCMRGYWDISKPVPPGRSVVVYLPGYEY